MWGSREVACTRGDGGIGIQEGLPAQLLLAKPMHIFNTLERQRRDRTDLPYAGAAARGTDPAQT